MTCFKNTLCVPLQYLCDSAASSTCSVSNGNGASSDDDDSGDNYSNVPILCQNQLCNPQNFPPLPYQGSGRIDRAYCLKGSFYSLYSGSDNSGSSSGSSSSTPKYTASCVEESMFLSSDGVDGSDEDSTSEEKDLVVIASIPQQQEE
ncbi:hypothetical protein BGW39_007208 [Mortierella sp. 14UC]|nr:hypothetical protein BGW39_007208 [Mortierella sp. 14UC]